MGRIEAGQAVFAAGEDPLGRYNIVTPAFILKFIELATKVQRLELELKLCQERQEKSK